MWAPTLEQHGMRYWRLQPDVRLRPWVSCYWMVEPAAAGAPGTLESADRNQVLIPDGHSELVFLLSGSLARWRVDEPGRVAQLRTSYLIGGRAQSVVARSATGTRMAGAKLDPLALRRIIGMPLTEFRDSTVSCADVGSQDLCHLEDAVAALRSPERLALVLDRYFLRKLDGVADDADIRTLQQGICITRGALPILRWAREHRIDVRTLERRFTARMGMTPKQYARVVRFKHGYHRLTTRAGGREHLDAYYDESHFSREFRHFLGATPRAWRAQALNRRTLIGDHLLQGEFARNLHDESQFTSLMSCPVSHPPYVPSA